MIRINSILLYKTLRDMDRIILLLRLSSASVSMSLSLVRVSVSLCVPSSPRTSVPTLSVSTAMAVERAILADVRSRMAVPCCTFKAETDYISHLTYNIFLVLAIQPTLFI